MMRYTEDAYAVCPFYLKESSTRLLCEGIPASSTNVTVFGSREGKAKYMERFCRHNYSSCSLCAVLMSKY